MSRRQPHLWLSAGLALCSSACFDGAPDDDAVILCVDDADCPAPRTCAKTHVCVEPGAVVDVDAPGVAAVAIAPAVASEGVVTVTVTADEDVVDVGLVFDGVADPGVVGGGVVGRVATFSLDVGARDAEGRFRVAEGFFPLRAVHLRDVAGNEREAPVSAFIEVDRTAPLLEGVAVSGDVDGVFSDLDPAALVTLSFRTSEPVTVVDAAFGNVALECGTTSSEDAGGATEGSAGESLGENCVGRLRAADVTHGANLVRLTVVDDAGNSASASVSATVDLQPPAVLAGSVEVDVDGDPNAAFAAVGDRVHVRVIFDEPVAGAPLFSLRDNPTIAFATRGAGQVFDGDAVVDRVIAAGSFAIDVDAADALGHRATTAVPLPPPFDAGLPLVPVPVSPCEAPNVFESNCADFDGDGAFGPSALCAPAVLDCDDRDPTIAPGALAIEDDGKQNTCAGPDGDRVPERIYVDADNGDDGNDGSAAAPFATMARATTVAGDDDAIFLAVGEYQVISSLIPQDVYGSLDPTTWTPSSTGRTVFVPGDNNCDTLGFVQGGPGVIVGVDFASRVALSGGVYVDVGLPDCIAFFSGRALARDLRGSDVLFDGLSAGSRIIDSKLGHITVQSDTVHLLRTRVSSGVDVEAGGGVEVVNSVVSGVDDALLTCTDCARVLVIASNIIADASSAAVQITDAPAAEVVVLAVNGRVRAGGAFVDVDGVTPQLLGIQGSVLDLFGGVVLRQEGATIVDATGSSFTSCNGNVCLDGILGNLTFDPTGFRTSEGVDVAGLAYRGGFISKFSGSYVADIDGECTLSRVSNRSGPDQ